LDSDLPAIAGSEGTAGDQAAVMQFQLARGHRHAPGPAARAGLGRAGDHAGKLRHLATRDQQAVGLDGDLPAVTGPQGVTGDLTAVAQFQLALEDRCRSLSVQRHTTAL
jgi:hypothetical protein